MIICLPQNCVYFMYVFTISSQFVEFVRKLPRLKLSIARFWVVGNFGSFPQNP
jgi:hypothetical protein